MKVKEALKITDETIRIILLVIGAVISSLVLIFVALAIAELQNENFFQCSVYLCSIFILLGLTRLISFLKERTLVNFLRFISLFIFNVVIGVIIMFAKDTPYLYALCGALFCFSIVLSRIFKIIKDHSVRNIIFNAIIIVLAVLLAIGLLLPNNEAANHAVLITCFVIAISALLEVIAGSTTRLQAKTLFKIILKTYALEIILGLFTTMVAISLILTFYEPKIASFGDALWYSFAVVTTIGFGDFAAETVIGRVLTAILGMYGIFVVAVLTSIIVNFYNETSSKHDSEKIKSIKDEEKKKK